MPRPELSVVVCTRNGEHRLAGVLSCLGRQSLDQSRYEVIVVDDGSEDQTAAVARSFGAHVVTLRPSRGLAAARNAGAEAAAADIIAFTDDDCEPAPDWLESLAAAFTRGSPDGVSGQVVARCENPWLLRYLESRNPVAPMSLDVLRSAGAGARLRRYLRSVSGVGELLQDGAELYSVVGANMALRRELIFELGGFDEAIDFGGEEEELCRRAHARPGGALFRYEPAAVVAHRFEPQVRDTLRRARGYGRGHPHSARVHRDVKLIVYPFPAAIAVVGLGLLARRRRSALALLAMAPMAVYARWPRQAWQARSAGPLAYAYLQLGEEIATMLGELEGLRARDHAGAKSAGGSMVGSRL